MIRIAMIVFTLFVPFLCYALDLKDLERYDSIVDSTQRLSYNGNKSKIDKTKKKIKKTGEWHIESYISPVDDSKTTILSVNADKPIQGIFSYVTPKLMITCRGGGLNIIVLTRMVVDIDSVGDYGGVYYRATIRFDKENAQTFKDMYISTDQQSLFFNDPRDIIKQMMTHKSLLFQFTPYGSNPVITTFDIRGLKEMISPFENECIPK